MPDLVAIGAGYSVRPLLEELVGDGWQVAATTRNPAKADEIEAAGIEVVHWTAPARLPTATLAEAKAIIVSTPPGTDGCPALASLRHVPLRQDARILYLSSSSVYGDHGGAWVDERTPCAPGTERGRRRLAVEEDWAAYADSIGVALVRCRLTGIYGPGRNAIDSLRGETIGARAGLNQRVVKPGHVFSRIHRDDICNALGRLLVVEKAPDIVNFADDLPSPPQDVIAYAAGLLGAPPPPEIAFELAELSPMARSFYEENKRVRNDVLRELVGQLRYPTYREGLRALL